MNDDDLKKVLVVDDEAAMRLMLKTYLDREGYRAATAPDARAAEALLRAEPFAAVITDLSMPGGSGLDLLKRVKEMAPDLPVIVMSAYGSTDSALTAMRAGAFDYVFKPFQPDEILFSLKKAETNLQLTLENVALKKAVGRRPADGLIYKSRGMDEIMRLAPKMAESDSPVLIIGESGTGKELVARAIHRASGRNQGPFVAVNCGAIAESLLESELFGHLRGSFTGASRDREGFFRAADQGTLFLDEIGELPLSFQVKLLRAIQFSEVIPVGGESPVKFNVRIVAATARDLEGLVGEHLFREDLYYRLNVLPLQLPPLRDRREDIPLLADHFIGILSARLGRPRPLLNDDFLEALSAYDWPGNIRELENLMDRLLVMAGGQPALSAADLPAKYKAPPRPALSPGADLDLKKAVRRLEAEYIRAALDQGRGNRSEAARRLGLSYPSLLSKIKLYGLEVGEEGPGG
ncbi:MAG: sigma-54 dependent transcriptional regulator [Candidatus Adiutrix sp.]|jgi:two-component system response regulator AtoC|nr:sigma-54 dependent transcriptional regulator [Candidatus Adiutrix sp.]